MKLNKFLLVLILLVVVVIGCAPQQPTNAPETITTPSAEKINPTPTNQTAPSTEKISTPQIKQQTTAKDDFGCWPPSCSIIPYPEDQKRCEDWKAGKPVAWPPDCTYFSGQPACQKLCESETSSAPAEQQEVAEPVPCNPLPLIRQFSNTPYYSGPLIDDHFHMPQMREIYNNLDAPVLDKQVSRHDVACLFDKDRVKNVFAFYGVPSDIRTQSVQKVRDLEKEYPGVIMHFLELVSFPGYPVVPKQIDETLNANKDLFKGYGEISLYLDFYQQVQPNDPAMRELYQIAEKHHLIVMMHPVNGQEQAMEEILHDFPNVHFLFHGAESLSSSTMYYDTFLSKYPNAYYSVDITIFGDAIFNARDKQDFITRFKLDWQSTLNKKVSLWKSRIEKHPDQILWGTDRGHALWHYDPEIAALLEEYSRAFIGQLDPTVQEKYAYKNAESLLQKR